MTRNALTPLALPLALAAGLALAACGDDDGGGSVQSDVADMTIEQMSDEGISLDEDCVHDIADQLSDDDANAILDGNTDDISEDGSLLSLELFDCVEE